MQEHATRRPIRMRIAGTTLPPWDGHGGPVRDTGPGRFHGPMIELHTAFACAAVYPSRAARSMQGIWTAERGGQAGRGRHPRPSRAGHCTMPTLVRCDPNPCRGNGNGTALAQAGPSCFEFPSGQGAHVGGMEPRTTGGKSMRLV
eukprot:scaffold177_cov334-Pavlova_lutheri.AAC.76